MSRGTKPGGTWSRGSGRVLRGGGRRQQSAAGAAEVPLPRERQVGHELALHGLDGPGLRFRRGARGGRGSAGGRAAGRAAGQALGVPGGPPWLAGPGRPLLATAGRGGHTQELGQHQVLLPQQPALVVGPVALSFGNELEKRCRGKGRRPGLRRLCVPHALRTRACGNVSPPRSPEAPGLGQEASAPSPPRPQNRGEARASRTTRDSSAPP